ncbi:unnamed protein product [Orchesella dallaii]|uniref:Multidrug resistance-associated protein 4 n=1 Tax=Orchesella dallaii TaxID=48710 RepID=A0ABP1RZP8_9HEXA
MASKHSRLDRLHRSSQFIYPKRTAKPPSPRENASFIQILLVSWLLPLLQIGMKREITERDLYPTLFEDYADHIGDTLEIRWGEHVEACKKNKKKPSIAKILMSAYGKKFMFYGLFSLAEETIFRMIQVFAIGYVLDYFEGNYLTTLTGTVIFGVGGILLGATAFLITFHWSFFNMHHVCTHIRLGLSSLVYRKIFHLNHASMRSSTVGQIVTMIASDLHRFDRKHIHINYLWIAPLHLMVVIYILYFHFNYGGSSLIGLVVLLFFTFTQYFMAKKFHHMRQKRVESSDLRIRAVSINDLLNDLNRNLYNYIFLYHHSLKLTQVVEIINAFYTIKVHCWERFFYDKAMDNRQQEVKILRTTLFLKLLNTALGFIVTKMAVFMTLLFAFILEEPGSIHSKRVFVTLVMYEHVRVNSMVLFPHAINDVAELSSACTRINNFLTLEELQIPANSIEALDGIIDATDRSPRIELQNVTCRWLKEESFHLENINIKAQAGQLIVVCGPVASGKSTLVAAVLGELPPEQGHVLVLGRIAYVPQVPALFPGSIRRNIIFGYGINLKWYHEVIRMCGLDGEFEKFPNGDQSLYENTQMTTAQKAKICIARALYANADVYVLDDPLQSMDVKHHRQILETVIRGALRDKVVLLVTHQIHFLEEATQIVLINHGRIHRTGTYDELLKAGIEFISEMEDKCTLDDDDSEEEESIIYKHGLVTDLTSTKDLRRRGSIQFQIDGSNLKKVSMGPASGKIRISRDLPVTEMALLVRDTII